MLSISTGLNALSNHGTCTAIFVAIAGEALASIPTLEKISWLAWIGVTCILSVSASAYDYFSFLRID